MRFRYAYVSKFLGFSFLISNHLFSVEIKIAVAANFADAIAPLAKAFEKNTSHKIVPAFGSTGKFYVQIKQGAPFDIFLAADVKHPQMLEDENHALRGTRFTYAWGKIALWSAKEGYVDAAGALLEQGTFQHLAIANPDVAPYGRAAKEYLIVRRVWPKIADRLILAQDIGQVYHFVSTGNAELGFVALSQLSGPGKKKAGSFLIVPQKFYSPIEQQAIQIKTGTGPAAFLEFLKSPAAQKIIREFGYAAR